MPKSAKNKTESPRDRLLEAAMIMFHHRGIDGTTLAEIAKGARVPPGNVYYHFRTKEALVEAVFEARIEELRDQFQAASLDPDPFERLRMLVRDGRRNRAELTKRGSPFAAIAHDLARDSGRAGAETGRLLEMYLEFAVDQFTTLGAGAASRDLAEEFICLLHGGFLLANQMGSSAFLERQLDRLEHWLERARAQIGDARAS